MSFVPSFICFISSDNSFAVSDAIIPFFVALSLAPNADSLTFLRKVWYLVSFSSTSTSACRFHSGISSWGMSSPALTLRSYSAASRLRFCFSYAFSSLYLSVGKVSLNASNIYKPAALEKDATFPGGFASSVSALASALRFYFSASTFLSNFVYASYLNVYCVVDLSSFSVFTLSVFTSSVFFSSDFFRLKPGTS